MTGSTETADKTQNSSPSIKRSSPYGSVRRKYEEAVRGDFRNAERIGEGLWKSRRKREIEKVRKTGRLWDRERGVREPPLTDPELFLAYSSPY